MSDARSASFTRLHHAGFWIGMVCALFLIFAPPLGDLTREAQSVAGVTVLMATLWITQALPIPVTSLIPLVAFPILKIQTAKAVSQAYIDQNIFLFMGGFIIAMGIEKWGLHKRMALHIVRILGTSPRRMVLGFMLATAFLSMWISNTASTLLMLPIGLALLSSLNNLPQPSQGLPPEQLRQWEQNKEAALDRFITVLLLGIAYSASIGGFTTLVGTPTNVTFLGIWQSNFSQGPAISAGQWMLAVTPLGTLYLLVAWWYLTRNLPNIPGSENLDRGFFTQRIHELGRPSRPELLMLAIFISTALLWMLRTKLTVGTVVVFEGWQTWFFDADWLAKKGIHDSTVAMGMAILLFIIPARQNEFDQTEFLMDWETAKKLPWGILLLIGGGFALAGAFDETRLSEFLAREFSQLVEGWPVWLLVAAVCFLLTFLTELTSNVATVATIVPVLGSMAVTLGLDPRLVMIPATIAASCAFMLPIATPPNAIVFGSNRINMDQMVRAGVALNLLGVVLITAAMFLLIVPQLGISLDTIPEWAVPQTSGSP